jgi:hypothetical protein
VVVDFGRKEETKTLPIYSFSYVVNAQSSPTIIENLLPKHEYIATEESISQERNEALCVLLMSAEVPFQTNQSHKIKSRHVYWRRPRRSL